MNEIPKKIHQIWIGDKPIPPIYEKYTNLVKILHPDYEYKLWNNDDLNSENFKMFEHINKMKKVVSKVDMMRYEILYNHGGFYLDCDIIMLKKLDKIWEENKKYELVVCNEDANINKYMSIGFISSQQYCKNFEILFNLFPYLYKYENILECNELTGPWFFKKCIDYNNSNINVLPTYTMYPVQYNASNKVNKYNFITKNNNNLKKIYGIHVWGKNW